MLTAKSIVEVKILLATTDAMVVRLGSRIYSDLTACLQVFRNEQGLSHLKVQYDQANDLYYFDLPAE
ncbi:hypothetical protein A2382_02940 [Candidatus Woesebacteria bacterium RIFOXYB1_FULL_38_16]|uniref:Uncharacterized protein n=1 Tax=Candidatus Woesebacteria bacterium RIFOXYB1_FULL_38_16 TaxID=1802538 RepID=A0A1F8CS40_9BACT|nr:MAG: hypothetical protein A2191_04785 [Candidatus Woesebacteria bacterium RIFOXYA1_FULL_38_9]OGM79163.1 MAG: hypothetical protein A2382_02940 [Candidatus Woesebacteria bacterium RIFOXYB1_FULL_38_16]